MRAALLIVMVLIALAAFNVNVEASNRLRKLRAKAMDVEEVQLEEVAEAEGEDEVEEDSEEEVEDEAEEAVELETEAVTEGETAVDAAILQSLEESEAVDGTWHVYSNVATEKAHEGITAYAVSQATPAMWDAKKIEQGTVWNDMPSGSDGNQAELDATLKDGHMDIDTWTRAFFGGAQDELVFNVHYGCLQHAHSMAPIRRVEAKSSAATRVVFTNTDVKNFIIAQIGQWWNAAAAAVKKGGADSKAWYSWWMGHVMHAVQDSYPRGHAVRAATASSCGPIVLFQGYDAQHGNGAHKAGDFTPPKKKETDPSLAKRYACARENSAYILKKFVACIQAKGSGAACSFGPISSYLSSTVYPFATGAATRKAGGSRADFAKKGIATEFEEEKNVDIGTGKISLFNPKSTKMWSAQRGIKLCDGPLKSKVKLGSFFYTQKPTRMFVEHTAPN